MQIENNFGPTSLSIFFINYKYLWPSYVGNSIWLISIDNIINFQTMIWFQKRLNTSALIKWNSTAYMHFLLTLIYVDTLFLYISKEYKISSHVLYLDAHYSTWYFYLIVLLCFWKDSMHFQICAHSSTVRLFSVYIITIINVLKQMYPKKIRS